MAKKLPTNAYLNERFSTYVEELGLAFRKTSSIQHAGDRGGSRESEIRRFLEEHLPRKYSVVSGEAVDLTGAISPQLDVMIFDCSENFPFETSGHTSLPSEALLVSIEIKSRLNIEEIRKSIAAAKKLRALRPFGKALGGTNIGSQAPPNSPCRYYHCIFAYATDIAEANWVDSEFERFQRENGRQHTIDAIYVLNRGHINVKASVGCVESDSGHAIASFYFSILNFLQREGRRRKPAPYDRYVSGISKTWRRLRTEAEGKRPDESDADL